MPTIQARNFRAYESGSLKGYVDLALPDVGVLIIGCSLHRNDAGHERVKFPRRSWTDSQGNVQWSPMVEPLGGSDQAEFQRLALIAVHMAAQPQPPRDISPETGPQGVVVGSNGAVDLDDDIPWDKA
jgi:hypothetical protein